MNDDKPKRDIEIIIIEHPDGSTSGRAIERHPPTVNNGRLEMAFDFASLDVPADDEPKRG